MMKGHPPFPGLDPWKDKLEIVSRFKAGQFSALDEVLGGDVVKKCWDSLYYTRLPWELETSTIVCGEGGVYNVGLLRRICSACL